MKRSRIDRADLAKYPHLKERIEAEASAVQRDTAPAPAPAPEKKEPESGWKRFGAAIGSAARGMHSGIKQYGEWVDKKNREHDARTQAGSQESRTEIRPPKKKPPVRERDYWPAASHPGRSNREPPQVIVIRDREEPDEPIIVRQRRSSRRQPRVIYVDDDDYDDDEDIEEPIIVKRKKKPVKGETKKKRHPAEDIFDSDKTLEFLGYDMNSRRKR